MSDNPGSEGAVSRAELEELAELFNAWEFAIDPASNEAKIAQSCYEDRASEIFGRVAAQFPSLQYSDFKIKLRSECRKFLRRN